MERAYLDGLKTRDLPKNTLKELNSVTRYNVEVGESRATHYVLRAFA